MKFLQEMIAKKKASVDVPPASMEDPDVEDALADPMLETLERETAALEDAEEAGADTAPRDFADVVREKKEATEPVATDALDASEPGEKDDSDLTDVPQASDAIATEPFTAPEDDADGADILPYRNGGLRVQRPTEDTAEAEPQPDIDDLDAHDAEEDLRQAFTGEGASGRFEPPAEDRIIAKIDRQMASAAAKDGADESGAPKKIWDIAKQENGAAPAPEPRGRRAGRVKTRLLGFHSAEDPTNDVFNGEKNNETQSAVQYPVGWIVVIDGPGRGASFALQSGVSQIGRGEDQAIKLDFGDTSISRENHAAIAFDDEQNKFFMGHGGKSNLVRLNDMPVLSTEPLSNNDTIRIGETTLRFVAFCGDEFNWNGAAKDDASVGHAANR